MTVTTHDFEGYTAGNPVVSGVGNNGMGGTPEYVSGLNGSDTAIELVMTGDGVVFNLPVGDWSIQGRVRGDFQITTGAFRAITVRTSSYSWVSQMRLHSEPRIDVADNSGDFVEDGGTDWVAGTEYLLEASYDSAAETVTWKERSADGTLVHSYAPYNCSHVAVPTHFVFGGGNSGAGAYTMTFDDVVIVDEKEYDFGPGEPPASGWSIWDGAQEIPATATIWDGAQEVPIGSVEVT